MFYLHFFGKWYLNWRTFIFLTKKNSANVAPRRFGVTLIGSFQKMPNFGVNLGRCERKIKKKNSKK